STSSLTTSSLEKISSLKMTAGGLLVCFVCYCYFFKSFFCIFIFSGFYDLPKRHGKLKDLKKFDAQFFSVTPKQANFMDPQVRMLLEVTWEAMIDAGKSGDNWDLQI